MRFNASTPILSVRAEFVDVPPSTVPSACSASSAGSVQAYSSILDAPLSPRNFMLLDHECELNDRLKRYGNMPAEAMMLLSVAINSK